jgi:hypothetical protein
VVAAAKHLLLASTSLKTSFGDLSFLRRLNNAFS